ncbi:MAG: STAS domain-containing protein [Spirochaetia bacterium]
MEVEISQEQGCTVIALTGRLDSSTTGKVEEQVTPLLNEGAKIIFDMSGCEYVSSAGLRLLLMTAKTLAREDGNGVLIGLNQEIQEVMDMTGFNNLFPVMDTKKGAIAQLS